MTRRIDRRRYQGLYAPLWVKSAYSFLEGASHPEELVARANELGLPAMAVTDRDGVYGMARAHVKAKELGFRLIVGSEITLFDDSTLILLAMDRRGYANLCQLISMGRLRSVKGESRVHWEEICERAPGLIALWGGRRSSLWWDEAPDAQADLLKEAFGDRLYGLLTRHRESGEPALERRLQERLGRYEIPLVAGAEVLYHTPERRPLQDVMTCIRHGVTLDTAGRLLTPNSEHALVESEAFAQLYIDNPEAVERTLEVADRARFSLSELRYRYPTERLPSGKTSSEWLRELTLRGLKFRYPGKVASSTLKQVHKELDLIQKLEYDGYFLTMWEIVQFCKANDILCQGRGSAANSIVCYCLEVTAVDPVRLGLLFERFISQERAEPPDIDLDIEHDRREEVIQHVYNKYGRTHAAMVANFIRYRSRSALRDVGKALGLDATALERFAKNLSGYESVSAERLEKVGWDAENPKHHQLLQLTLEIQDMPRHLSIHPGGFLLGHEPVGDFVPIENGSMADRTVIQWDKEDVEELGLFKVDLLGLGALNVTHRAFDLIREHHRESWTLATIPPEDEATFEMMRRADTVGVFQIESRAQMAMLPRLKPKTYYDLVVEISIVRPGPITGGMVHPYLRRRNGEEPVIYPHDCLRPVLEKTLGVPLFQEQVMRLAMVAADYSPGEADRLRRDMAAWRKEGRMERHRERLLSRMTEKGIAREFAERVFDQIRGFGEYGFPESHAASFALIAYATAWLKRHYPSAFLCAMLNAQPMGFYSPSTLIEDAKRHGAFVLPVCVAASDWECRLAPDPRSAGGYATRMGLNYIRGFSEKDAARLLEARNQAAFRSVDDVAYRSGLGEGAMSRLAESGALAMLDAERRDALWSVYGWKRPEIDALSLELPEPDAEFENLDVLETIDWDFRMTSHSSRAHPVAPLRETLTRMGLPDAATLREAPHGSRARYAGMVICRQRPGTAKGVVFMTLEDETGFVNLVIWEKVFRKHQIMAKTASFLGVTGKLQSQENVVHLVAQRLWKPQIEMGSQAIQSRDFH